MSGPEANQQYGLWVDRCREQLARGAAGGTLAAWMQSEGMSAEMAASVVQAAGGDPSAASGMTSHSESATPASALKQEAASAIAPVAPAQHAMAQHTATAATDGGAPLPPRIAAVLQRSSPAPENSGPAEIPPPYVPSTAGGPSPGHTTTTPPPSSTLFGTPRPPVSFSPVRPPSDAPAQQPPSSEEDVVSSEPKSGADVGQPPHDAARLDEVQDHDAGRLDEPVRDDPQAGTEDEERPDDDNPAGFAEGDAEPLNDPILEAARPPDSLGSAVEAPEPETTLRKPPRDDAGPDSLASYDPDHPDETDREAADGPAVEEPVEETSGEEIDAEEGGHDFSARSLDDPIGEDIGDDRGLSAARTDPTEPEPAEAPDIEPDKAADSPARAPDGKHGFGRRICNAAPVPSTEGGEEPARSAGDSEGADSQAAAADEGESELSRLLRDSEQAVDPDLETPRHYPEPKTDEELAAAAKKLGISFREEAGKNSHLEPSDEDDEMARTARELGIRFRDDPDAPAHADPDDPTAKAARELGINFRDLDRPKAKPQSTLRRYWPIILVMALASIAIPVGALLMMYYWG